MAKLKQVRTCFVCGNKDKKENLLKWVSTPKGILPDLRCVVDGRGLYTCENKECIKKLYSKKKFPEKFCDEVKFVFSLNEVLVLIKKEIEKSIFHYISLSWKSRNIIKGQNMVKEILKEDLSKLSFIILSEDLSDKTKTFFEKSFDKTIVFSTKNILGNTIGSKPVGVLGFIPSPLSKKVHHNILLNSNFI